MVYQILRLKSHTKLCELQLQCIKIKQIKKMKKNAKTIILFFNVIKYRCILLIY